MGDLAPFSLLAAFVRAAQFNHLCHSRLNILDHEVEMHGRPMSRVGARRDVAGNRIRTLGLLEQIYGGSFVEPNF